MRLNVIVYLYEVVIYSIYVRVRENTNIQSYIINFKNAVRQEVIVMYDKKAEIINKASAEISALEILPGYKGRIHDYLSRIYKVCCQNGSGSLWDLENQLRQDIGTMDYDINSHNPLDVIDTMFQELKFLKQMEQK